MLLKPPLRTNGVVSSRNLSLFGFLLAPVLHRGVTQPTTGLGAKGPGAQGGRTPAGAAGDEARYGRVLVPRKQDVGIKLSPSTTLGDITSETVTTPSYPAPLFAPSVPTPDIRANAIEPRDSSTRALPRDVPVTGDTPAGPFRYTPEAEAKIRDAVLQPNYPLAYQLFEPSERFTIIEGDELERFTSKHPNRVTGAGRKAAKLWVCQATATWATDGTVSYTPQPCGAACTSRDICIRHISTQHLAKSRGKTALQ